MASIKKELDIFKKDLLQAINGQFGLLSKSFVTKKELKSTNNQTVKAITEQGAQILNTLPDIISSVIEEKGLVTKEDIKHLPTKEEFYESQDKLVGELKTMREEHIVQGEQVRRNTRRIEKVENRVGVASL